MLKKILLNALIAWKSSVVGILMPVATGVVTDLTNGHVNWSAVAKALVPAGILLITDIFNEIKKEAGLPA